MLFIHILQVMDDTNQVNKDRFYWLDKVRKGQKNLLGDNLVGATFASYDLRGLDFSGVNLSKVNFGEV